MSRWAAILAGGEGSRLKRITTAIAGDDRPKQFCRVIGGKSLLELTQERLAASVAPSHSLLVLAQSQRPYYAPLTARTPEMLLVEQPSNKGTSAAIAYALGRATRLDSEALLGVFPSDHYYRTSSIVHRTIQAAYELAELHPQKLLLIGATPDSAEPEYGWIEPGCPYRTPVRGSSVFAVSGFLEKPGPVIAEDLFKAGALWNTFIVVGSVKAFDTAFARTLTAWRDFASCVAKAGSPFAETRAASAAFAALPSSCFSSDVVSRVADMCLVLRMSGAGWIDVGNPDRLARALQSTA